MSLADKPLLRAGDELVAEHVARGGKRAIEVAAMRNGGHRTQRRRALRKAAWNRMKALLLLREPPGLETAEPHFSPKPEQGQRDDAERPAELQGWPIQRAQCRDIERVHYASTVKHKGTWLDATCRGRCSAPEHHDWPELYKLGTRSAGRFVVGSVTIKCGCGRCEPSWFSRGWICYHEPVTLQLRRKTDGRCHNAEQPAASHSLQPVPEQCETAEQTAEEHHNDRDATAQEDSTPNAMDVVYELILDGKASKQTEEEGWVDVKHIVEMANRWYRLTQEEVRTAIEAWLRVEEYGAHVMMYNREQEMIGLSPQVRQFLEP